MQNKATASEVPAKKAAPRSSTSSTSATTSSAKRASGDIEHVSSPPAKRRVFKPSASLKACAEEGLLASSPSLKKVSDLIVDTLQCGERGDKDTTIFVVALSGLVFIRCPEFRNYIAANTLQTDSPFASSKSKKGFLFFKEPIPEHPFMKMATESVNLFKLENEKEKLFPSPAWYAVLNAFELANGAEGEAAIESINDFLQAAAEHFFMDGKKIEVSFRTHYLDFPEEDGERQALKLYNCFLQGCTVKDGPDGADVFVPSFPQHVVDQYAKNLVDLVSARSPEKEKKANVSSFNPPSK